MAATNCNIKKNDLVQVIAGREIGKKGKVMAVFPSEGKGLVEKTNMVKCTTKPSGISQHGGVR